MALDTPGTVYLIHFHKPYLHCNHYIGWTGLGIDERMKRHGGSGGASLLRACKRKGIKYTVVRTWAGGTPALEIALKKRKNAKQYCPVCNPEKYMNNGAK